MELSLKEKFIIIAYHPQKGSSIAGNFLSYGIGGAILFELAEQKRINVENKRVKLLDTHKTGDEVLDRAMEILKKSSKPYRVKSFISKIANKPSKFKRPIVEGLTDKRVLKEVRKKFLFFSYKRFPAVKPKNRDELINRIRKLVLKKAESDTDTVLLAGLAGACQFVKKFFHTKEERKIAKIRVKEIVENSQIDQAIDETIKAVQAAVLVAVTTSAVAASSS